LSITALEAFMPILATLEAALPLRASGLAEVIGEKR